MAAVEAHAVREGIDPALVKSDEMPSIAVDADLSESDTELFRFKITDTGEAQVQFMANGNSKGTDIATLVRRMVQSVQNRGYNPAGGSLLSVDMNALYNALGIFRGVQYARDEYISTVSTKNVLTKQEIRGRRKPFLEHLRTLGIRPPLSGTADIEGLDELIILIEARSKEKIQAAYDMINDGMYDFDCLAELYKPGSNVVARDVCSSGVDSSCKVTWCRYEERKTLFGITRVFKVSFEFLVAVGGHFTLCEFVEEIENFDRNKRASLSSLPCIPLTALEQEAQTQLLLKFRQRGEMYSKCVIGAHFLGYSQGSFYSKSGGKSQHAALRTSGRVMVDTKGSYDAGHSVSIGYDPMVLAIKYKYKEYMLQMRQQQQQPGQVVSSDDAHDNMILFDTVPDDYLSMTWPSAVGFSFSSKSWGDVLVDGLEEIKFEEATFDRLVLPPARKRMIKALVRHSSDSFSDIVSGKGEGSVFLLYGPPGVGKTLTAEAISEMLHRPLYSVSLGQLGTTPAELETKLGEILDLCGKWDALILLDEADIFLEKRSSNGSLERNSMVSIMLRLVEYFKGVLFLTSNRVDSLDPAFKTRITLALRYEELDKTGRNQVWLNLLDASGQGEALENGSINTSILAEKPLNGREIKNAIRLAMALAKEDDVPLTHDAIMETVDVLLDFNEKMNSAEEYK
jgi:AAA+ superfamily predicted ATPase